MAQPTSALRTLRPELSTFEELDREMQKRGYVATSILSAYEVGAASGTFSVIKLKSLLANASADTKRTVTGGYNRGEYEWEERSFQTKENGWEEPIDEREQNMYASFFDMEEIAAYRAWEHVLNSLERRVIAATVAGTVTAGYTAAASVVWTTKATAVPIDDVYAAQEAVWLRTGVWPRTLTMSRRTFRALRRCVTVLDEIKADGAGQSAEQKKVTPAMLAEALDVDEIIIADSIKNTANAAKSPVIASVFPDDQVLVSRSAKTKDFKEPCLGRLFHWGGDGSQINDERLIGVAERYEEPQTRKEIVRVRHETSEFILYPQMGQVITGVR